MNIKHRLFLALSDGRYSVALDSKGRPAPIGERIAGVVRAVALGILGACALVHWIAEAL